jgi:hypothetical protein
MQNIILQELIKLAEEQKQLDIEILNEFIYKLNTNNSLRIVMWDRDVRKSRIRTRGVKKNSYKTSESQNYICL